MWVGYGGTLCSLVIMFCLSCAENDSAVHMIAEGNDNHGHDLESGAKAAAFRHMCRCNPGDSRHFRYVTQPPDTGTEITLSRMTVALAAFFGRGF